MKYLLLILAASAALAQSNNAVVTPYCGFGAYPSGHCKPGPDLEFKPSTGDPLVTITGDPGAYSIGAIGVSLGESGQWECSGEKPTKCECSGPGCVFKSIYLGPAIVGALLNHESMRTVIFASKAAAYEEILKTRDAEIALLKSHVIDVSKSEQAISRTNQLIKMLSDKCPSGKLDQDAKCVAVDPKK